MTREGRPGLKRKQPELRGLRKHQPEGTTKKSKVTVDKSPQKGSVWINVLKRNPLFKSNSVKSPSRKKRNDSEDRPKSPAFHLLNSCPEIEERAPTPASTIDIDLDLDNFKAPSHLVLPFFRPRVPEHGNWVFWRIYSAELHGKIGKHIGKYKGTYLSHTMLEELFYQKIHDDCSDYDPMQSEGVQITKIYGLCQENNRQRLAMDAIVIPTADDTDLTRTERKIFADDSLAELLSLVLKEGDFMMIFGHNCLLNGPTIALNSRQQQINYMAVYRHDAIFTPEKEENSDNLIIPFDYKKFRYICTEKDDDECVLKIEPYHKSILAPGLAPIVDEETTTEKVNRYFNSVNPDNNLSSSPVSEKEKVPSRQNEVDEHSSKSSSFAGDYNKALYDCFTSSASSMSSKSKDKALPSTLKTPQKSPNKHATNIRNCTRSGSSASPKINCAIFDKSHDSNSSSNQKRNTFKLGGLRNLRSKLSSPNSLKELEQDDEDGQPEKMKDSLSETSSTDQMNSEVCKEVEKERKDKEKQKSKKSPNKPSPSQKSLKTPSPSKRSVNTPYKVSKRTSGSKAVSPRSPPNGHSVNDVSDTESTDEDNPYRNMTLDTQNHCSSSDSSFEDSDTSSVKEIVLSKATPPVTDSPVEMNQPEPVPENESTKHGNIHNVRVKVVLVRVEDDPALSLWHVRKLLKSPKRHRTLKDDEASRPNIEHRRDGEIKQEQSSPKDYKKEFRLKNVKVKLKRIPQSTLESSSTTQRPNERRDNKQKDGERKGKRNLRSHPSNYD